MVIVVNNIAASSGGALTVLKNFHEFVINDDSAQKHKWIFLLSSHYIEDSSKIRVIVMKNSKKWINKVFFDFFLGRFLIRSIKPDVVFSMQNTITYGVNCPQVVYMHQSLPFQRVKKFSFVLSSERKIAIYQYLIGHIIKLSMKHATHIVVQTNWIKDSIIDMCKIPERKISVVLPEILKSTIKIKQEYSAKRFFYPANNLVYKNHIILEKATESLIKRGIEDFTIEITADKKSRFSQITSVGEISPLAVLNKFSNSTLVFPSYIETIGLPLLEARSVGTLILAANTPFSREALQDYENVFYFNPFDDIELANLMEKVINSEISPIRNLKSKNERSNSWVEVIKILEKEVEGK